MARPVTDPLDGRPLGRTIARFCALIRTSAEEHRRDRAASLTSGSTSDYDDRRYEGGLAGVTDGAGSAGLATPTARWIILFVLGTGALSTHIDYAHVTSWPIMLFGFLCSAVAAVVLTVPGDHRLPGRYAAVFLLSVNLTAIAGLLSTDSTGWVWMFGYAAQLSGLVIARGNILLGVLSGAATFGTGLAHLLLEKCELSTGLALLMSSVVAVGLGVFWRLALESFVARERGHRVSRLNAYIRAQAEEEITLRYRAQLAEISELTVPLLRGLASGRAIDEEFLTGLRVAEGSVRDRIRSPGLQHPVLNAAIAGLRAEGTRVLLLGEPFDNAIELDDDLAVRIAELLESRPLTEVTLRSIPGNRTVSALLVGPDGTDRVVLGLADPG